MHTPFFSAWQARLAPMGSRLAKDLKTFRGYTLCQLEEHFAHFVPQGLFPTPPKGRRCPYSRPRTFWLMLWQAFNPAAPCREVVRQLQALLELCGGGQISENNGAFCRAKDRLPLKEFSQILEATAETADRHAPALSWLQGRPIKIADGSSLTAPDTAKNRKAYPPVKTPEPNFPMMRLMVLFSLTSGAVLSLVMRDMCTAELPMLYGMFNLLCAKDVLLADRGFGNFVLLALLQHFKPGVDFIGRSARRCDGRRRLKRLGPGDWLTLWKSGGPSLWLPNKIWQLLPTQITVRIVRGSCHVKGFRVRQVTLVTTLLDPELYPAREILQAYLRRWRLELCLDDLKTTLQMDMLSSLSPKMLQREVYAHVIAHNLVRCTMAQAASEHHRPLERLSFKGSLDALRQFTQAINQARTKKKRAQLWAALLQALANDLVPERPGRREPRAVKRMKRKYDRLNKPRHLYKDRPKRNTRRTISRLRNAMA